MKNKITQSLLLLAGLLMLSSQIYAGSNIKGTVKYHNSQNSPIPNVEVNLYNGNEIVGTTYTNNNGSYTFHNVPTGTYTVRGIITPLEPGGYDLLDGFMILWHALGFTTLEGIEFLAADLNHSNSVDMTDYLLFLTQWQEGFVPEWVFESEIINHDGTKTNVPTMSGSSSGDVNGTFVPTTRTEPFIPVNFVKKQFTNDFSIEIYAKDLNALSAMGVVLDYPSTVNIERVSSPIGELDNVAIKDNEIAITWLNEDGLNCQLNSNDPIAIIHGKVNYNFNGGDIKFKVSNKTNFVKSGTLVNPELSVTYLSENSNDYLSHCYPNPANSTTTVYFNVPTDSKTSIDIYNLSGQLVKTVVNEVMSQGNHSISINTADLREGVYFCNLKTNGTSVNQTKRLVVVH